MVIGRHIRSSASERAYARRHNLRITEEYRYHPEIPISEIQIVDDCRICYPVLSVPDSNGVAWRVVDSRFFGVPQRRRRVFIVGALADGDTRAASERAGQVLAVGTRCDRHPATRGEAREEPAVASLSGLGSGGPDDNDGQAGRRVAAPLTKGSATGDGVNAPGRRQEDDVNLVAFHANQDPIHHHHHTPALGATSLLGVADTTSVRRLTPTECERLQAWPDGWTNPHGDAPDSRRYAACGDGVTATVAEWIGRRIVEATTP